MRSDELDPLPYDASIPSLMGASGRVDVHSIVAKFLSDSAIRGAYLEFGVGAGRSAVSALRAYSRAAVCDRFVLFDSFQGLPALTGVDANSKQFFRGQFAHSKAEVEAFIRRHKDVAHVEIEYVEGWFKEEVHKWLSMNRVAAVVVHVDLDLHESCAQVLDAIAACLQPGTVMLFDDWNAHSAQSNCGERRAVRNWIAAHGDRLALHDWFSYGWHGRAFIVDVLKD